MHLQSTVHIVSSEGVQCFEEALRHLLLGFHPGTPLRGFGCFWRTCQTMRQCQTMPDNAAMRQCQTMRSCSCQHVDIMIKDAGDALYAFRFPFMSFYQTRKEEEERSSTIQFNCPLTNPLHCHLPSRTAAEDAFERESFHTKLNGSTHDDSIDEGSGAFAPRSP